MTQYIQSESMPAVIFPFTANALIIFSLPRHSSPSFPRKIMGGSKSYANSLKQLLYSWKIVMGGLIALARILVLPAWLWTIY